MELKELNNKEKELFNYCQYLRLNNDKTIIENKIASCKKESNKDNNFITGAKNLFKGLKGDIMGYDATDTKVDEELTKYCENNGKYLNDDEAKTLLEDIYQNDNLGLAKLLFSCGVVLDNQYEYQYEDEGLRVVSKFLYNRENVLENIRTDLVNNYRSIVHGSIEDIEKAFLIVLGVSTCALAISTPFAIAGALAAPAYAAVVGSFTSALFFLGATEIVNDVKRKEILKEFRQLKPNEQGFYLALQLLIIQKIKQDASQDELKSELDDVLKSTSALKEDLDFYTFVEQEDLSNNKEKMEQFHRFDTLLFKQLDLNK